MAFYLLFLFPKNLEAHTTMALAHHPTPVLPRRDFWCLYPTKFPSSEHHPTFFWVILPNLFPKASLTQSMATLCHNSFYSTLREGGKCFNYYKYCIMYLLRFILSVFIYLFIFFLKPFLVLTNLYVLALTL